MSRRCFMLTGFLQTIMKNSHHLCVIFPNDYACLSGMCVCVCLHTHLAGMLLLLIPYLSIAYSSLLIHYPNLSLLPPYLFITSLLITFLPYLLLIYYLFTYHIFLLNYYFLFVYYIFTYHFVIRSSSLLTTCYLFITS